MVLWALENGEWLKIKLMLEGRWLNSEGKRRNGFWSRLREAQAKRRNTAKNRFRGERRGQGLGLTWMTPKCQLVVGLLGKWWWKLIKTRIQEQLLLKNKEKSDNTKILSIFGYKLCYSIKKKIPPSFKTNIWTHKLFALILERKILTFAKECIISERTSESGSVPMALISASHIKCHICVRYSGPRTLAHSRRRGMDSAAATRTRFIVKENILKWTLDDI